MAILSGENDRLCGDRPRDDRHVGCLCDRPRDDRRVGCPCDHLRDDRLPSYATRSRLLPAHRQGLPRGALN